MILAALIVAAALAGMLVGCAITIRRLSKALTEANASTGEALGCAQESLAMAKNATCEQRDLANVLQWLYGELCNEGKLSDACETRIRELLMKAGRA
jgi:hypothetical protein